MRGVAMLLAPVDVCWCWTLRHAEEQVHRPAAAGVLLAGSAMPEQVGVVAAGLLQGVREDRHVLPAALAVDRLGDLLHRGVLPVQPGGGEGGNGAKRIRKDIAE